MESEQFIELTALEAAGALDSADKARLGELLESADARARAGAAAFGEAAALVGVTQSPARRPAASLKGKILARIQSGGRGAVPPVQSPFFFVHRDEGNWENLPVPGVRVKNLSIDARRGLSVKLYELAPGARFPGHRHSGPEECFVVSGDFHVEGRVLHTGDFHHAESDTGHGESHTEHGCTLLVMATASDYL